MTTKSKGLNVTKASQLGINLHLCRPVLLFNTLVSIAEKMIENYEIGKPNACYSADPLQNDDTISFIFKEQNKEHEIIYSVKNQICVKIEDTF